jgi:hypothetical protein
LRLRSTKYSIISRGASENSGAWGWPWPQLAPSCLRHWPETFKNSLARLWSMCKDSNSTRIEEKIRNAQLFQSLSEEKKLNKNCTSLLAYVKQWMDVFENLVLQ